VTPEEQAIMAELESIINGAAQELNDERKTQHLLSMPFLAEAAREAISHKETEAKPIHLFAIQEVDKAGMGDDLALIDGTPVARDEAVSNPELIGARFSYVHAFESGDDALSVLCDPETAVAFEGTMPNSGLYLEAEVAGDKVSALFAAQCLTLRKHIGKETVTHYIEPNTADADDFLLQQVGLKPETANLIKALVMFRNNPQNMRRNYPNTFDALYEKWKDKMRKADEGDNE